MKRKIKGCFLKRAGGRCKSAEVLYFRLGVIGDESIG